jgi:hypothetical protein
MDRVKSLHLRQGEELVIECWSLRLQLRSKVLMVEAIDISCSEKDSVSASSPMFGEADIAREKDNK